MVAAIRGGANIVACQMSIHLIGICREELIDSIHMEAASCLEASEQAGRKPCIFAKEIAQGLLIMSFLTF
jgi:peroxiredoxin family protein